MKKILFTLLFVASAFIINAQPPEGDAKPGDFYGAEVDPDGAIDIAKIPAMLAEKESFDTKVKAKIIEVCPKKGCWLKLEVADGTTALVCNFPLNCPSCACAEAVRTTKHVINCTNLFPSLVLHNFLIP